MPGQQEIPGFKLIQAHSEWMEYFAFEHWPNPESIIFYFSNNRKVFDVLETHDLPVFKIQQNIKFNKCNSFSGPGKSQTFQIPQPATFMCF